MNIGIGQDSHKFGMSGILTLGGITIEGYPKLEANSDGDVVLHALCNAIASSVGKGSLGEYADAMFSEGIIDSKEYLKKSISFIGERKINNVSISIEAKEPRLDAHLPQMKTMIAELLHIEEDSVGITVASGEGLTSFGKGEGMNVIAAITLR